VVLCTICTESELRTASDMRMMSDTVKAREHYGANSLDLTIPTKVVEELDLSPGDIFEITVDTDDEDVTLSYELVYKSS